MSQNTQHSEHIVPIWLYLVIFTTLIVLTGVTATVAFVDLSWKFGQPPNVHVVNFNPLVALAIAIFKATLVVLFFMHVKYSSRLTKIVVGAGVFWLLILLSLTMTDYLSRSLQTAPPMH
jgi:cytochrome c oxidase subunit 4